MNECDGQCGGCGAMSRRDFLVATSMASAALAGGCAPTGLIEETEDAEERGIPGADERPVRVGLVFLSRARSSWPHPHFDVEAREREVLEVLRKGSPGVEFVPVPVRSPREASKVAALAGNVDGLLVYVVTLTWNLQRALGEIAKLGKPTIVADEFLGGSGVFLVGLSAVRRRGIPVAAVSSTRLGDLVTVARCFRALKRPGVTPAAFAEQCERAYRGTFPEAGAMKCADDRPSLADVAQCVERLRKYRFIIVGRGTAGRTQDFLGAKGTYVGFPELKAIYDKVDADKATEWADRWAAQADKVVEAKPDWIRKAGAVYLATLELLKRYRTDTVTMNCLGGFGSGRLPAYPCLGFMQLLNDGAQGVCEAMPDDTLSMLMARLLTGRPGYVSDPAIDTSKNQVVYAHCVGPTKVFGPGGESNMYRIRTLHDRDPRGVCAQSFMPEGYMTTSFRTSFARKLMVIHQAKAVGNLDAERGCRTQLVGEVRGDIGRMFDEWDRFGWHRVTVYGDVKEPLMEFGKALGLKIVEEG